VTRDFEGESHKELFLDKSPIFARVARGDLLDVVLGDLLSCRQLGEDGEFRTDEAAKAAVDAILCLKTHFRRMVALHIEAFALFETSVGAEFDAKTASLASVFDDPDLSVRNGMRFRVQG